MQVHERCFEKNIFEFSSPLTAQEHSRKELLEKRKIGNSEQKLVFNITSYPYFQEIRNILQELHLLACNKEYKKVFLNVTVAGFCNSKNFNDYRATLSKSNKRRFELYRKKICLVYNAIRTNATFTTEACRETLEIWSSPLNCILEKVLYLLKWKICGEAPYIGKTKTKFWYELSNYKSKHRAFRKGNCKNTPKTCSQSLLSES